MNLSSIFRYCYTISHGTFLLCGHTLCMHSVYSGIWSLNMWTGNPAGSVTRAEMDASFVLFKASRRVTLREEDVTVEKIAKIFQVVWSSNVA